MKVSLKKQSKVVAIIQARMGSSRLPGKVMKKVCKKPLLLLMLERLQTTKTIDKIVIATTRKKRDYPIVQFAKKYGYDFFCGSELDCLDRHYKAGKKFNATYLVKITSDCPLIDPHVVDKTITYFLENSDKYDYVSNLHPATYPDGQDVEIYPISILEKAWKKAKKKEEREHTTTYIWSHPEKFRIGNVVLETGKNLFKTHRWCLDYKEDYMFIKKIFEKLYEDKKIFHMNDVLDLLRKRKNIYAINRHLLIYNRIH